MNNQTPLDPPYIEGLKRFLLHMPMNSNYELDEASKKLLRKNLCLAISCGGQHYQSLFPKLFAGDLPLNEALRKLDEEINWLFAEYDTCVPTPDNFVASAQKPFSHQRDLPCARVFRRGEPIFKCSTCALDETCALCAFCYHPDQHQGHVINVTVCQRENGGVCDCGDPEAWVHQFNCRDGKTQDSDFEAVREVPDDFHQAFARTIDILLDYIIDVMCQSDLQFDFPWDMSSSPKKYAASNPLDPKKYGYPHENFEPCEFDQPSDKFSLIAYNNQVHHFRDAIQRIHLASKKLPEFAVMVADQIHRHGRARVIQSRNLALLFERQKSLSSTGLISCIRNARDEFRENMCHEILLWIGGLVERDVFKSSDNLKNALCQSFCSRWDKGIPHANFNGTQGPKRGKLDANFNLPRVEPINPSNQSDQKWYFNPAEKWDVPSDLSEQCQYDQNILDYTSQFFQGSRFQYMIYLDIRFWKSIRVVLHTIYSTSLITNLNYKAVFCCQYVDIYPGIADMFLALDGEPEVNIMSTLSTQLFTCLSNSTRIIDRGEASRIFASIFNFLRTGNVPYMETPVKDQYKISLTSLKNRRWGQILFDIGYILGRGRDKNLILKDTSIPMVCDILTLFQGKPVMIREKENHIEYESSDYTAFFQAVLVIYQFAEYVAHAITNLTPELRRETALYSISYVVHQLISIENKDLIQTAPIDHNSTDYGCDFSSTEDSLDRASAGKELKQSFLHPLHSLLGWLIEFARLDSKDDLLRVINDAIDGFRSKHSTFQFENLKMSLIYQYPIRTIVLSSQIKSGYWVRNGFSVRTQLQLYKSTNLRDQGYLRDLFLIQTFLSIVPPEIIVPDILKLWSFYEWATNDLISPMIYDADIFPYMLEECLSSFIHILTEDLFLRGASSDETTQKKIRNEIIHNLCFGPMSFSKLCTQIPEHISADKRFEVTLEKLSTYKKPKTAKDTGTYTLKESCLEEINPFYFNYNINKKDDAIKFVKERLQLTSNKRYHDIVIEPKVMSKENLGMYGGIGNFTTSPLFAVFLIKILRFVKSVGANKMEGLIETILHLIHICCKEKTITHHIYGCFFDQFCQKFTQFNTSLAQELYQLLDNDTFKSQHSKLRAIYTSFDLKQTSTLNTLAGSIDNFDVSKIMVCASDMTCENEDDRKKRLAKGRQQKLLAKFKKQQSLFLKINSEQYDGSDTEMADAELEGWQFPETHCIVCQDTAQEAGPFGLLTHISKSSEFRKVPFNNQYWFLKAFSDNSSLNVHPEFGHIPENVTTGWKDFITRIEDEAIFGPGFTDHECIERNVTSVTCGHGMHFLCYLQYLSTCRPRLSQLTRNPPDVVENREFLCPLCKSLNNMFIPLLWANNNRSMKEFVERGNEDVELSEISILRNIHQDGWFKRFMENNTDSVRKFLILAPSSIEMFRSNSFMSSSDVQNDFRLLITNMYKLLAMLSFPVDFEIENPVVFVNSLKFAEISLRGLDTNDISVINQLSNNTLINLRVFNEFRLTLMEMEVNNWTTQPTNSAEFHLKQLSHLQMLSADHLNETILCGDFLEVLVNCIPFRVAGISFNSILRICFSGLIIQTANILFSQIVANNFFENENFNILDVPVSEVISDREAHAASSLFMNLQQAKSSSVRNNSIANDERFGYVFYSMLLKSVTPFLRQALIYVYVCCADVEGVDFSNTDMIFEADQICQILNIPTLNSMLTVMTANNSSQTEENHMMQSFLTFLKNSEEPEDPLIKTSLDYPGHVRLINLPTRLDRFFTEYYYLEKYQNPHLTIENPALCMYCASVVDVQKGAIDSTYGQCSAHFASECNNSVGIFLLPKERSLVLLHRNGGSFFDAPYLDQHGELSGENKKGKTAHLLKERYEDFTRNMWLMHNIPNYIARRLDSTIDAGGWETL